MKALSLRQPWCDAILYGGKRVENRLKWRGTAFRGPFLLHAAKGCTRAEYTGVIGFLEDKGIAWRPKPYEELVRGALVGVAWVKDVVMPGGVVHAGDGYPPSRKGVHVHELADDPYYMGEFAIVLNHVRVLSKPTPYKGALGFFEVPTEGDGELEQLGLDRWHPANLESP